MIVVSYTMLYTHAYVTCAWHVRSAKCIVYYGANVWSSAILDYCKWRQSETMSILHISFLWKYSLRLSMYWENGRFQDLFSVCGLLVFSTPSMWWLVLSYGCTVFNGTNRSVSSLLRYYRKGLVSFCPSNFSCFLSTSSQIGRTHTQCLVLPCTILLIAST